MNEPTKKFTTQQRDNFRAYERVRKGSRWNMYDPRAVRATGLDREEYVFVMNNFAALKATVEKC